MPKNAISIEKSDAAAVLHFWFDELAPDQHFARDPELDRIVMERFGDLRARMPSSAAGGGPHDWPDAPDRLLAAVIVLDQFSRHIHRGSGEAYAADALARSLALHALNSGREDRFSAEQRLFLYMPLAHAEDMDSQALSVFKCEALGNTEALHAAREHAEVIRRFGRFPSRNDALGRVSTPAEAAYLRDCSPDW